MAEQRYILIILENKRKEKKKQTRLLILFRCGKIVKWILVKLSLQSYVKASRIGTKKTDKNGSVYWLVKLFIAAALSNCTTPEQDTQDVSVIPIQDGFNVDLETKRLVFEGRYI